MIVMNWSSKEKNPHTFITRTDSLTLFFPKGYVKILLQRFSFVFLDGMFHPLRFLDATKFDSSLDSVKPFSLLFLYIYFIIDSCYAFSCIIILKGFFVPLEASGLCVVVRTFFYAEIKSMAMHVVTATQSTHQILMLYIVAL